MVRLVSALVFVFGSAVSFAGPTLVLDFEGNRELADYGTFEKGVFLATPGYGGSARCIAQHSDGIYADISYTLPRPVALTPGSTLRFAHRVVTEGKAKYLGIYILTSAGKLAVTNVPTGAEWKVDEIKLIGMTADQKSDIKEPLAIGDAVTKITLYGRLAEPAEQTTYVDDIALTVPGAAPMTAQPASKPAPGTRTDRSEAGPALPPLREGELFSYDFEKPAVEYAGFKGGAIVSPGYESAHAWAVSGKEQFLRIEFPCDFVLRDNMYIEADTQVVTQTGARLYIGLNLYRDDGKKVLISNMASTADWEQNSSRGLRFWGVEDKSQVKDRPQIGERYTRCALYSKVAEAAPQTLIVDNLRLVWEGGAPAALHGEAFRAAHPRTIDGDLSDWTEVDAADGLVIGEAGHAHQHAWYGGPADASALVYVLYDDEFLYAAFEVSDDVVRNPSAAPEAIHQADCCVVGLAPAFPAQEHDFSRAYMFSPGDFAGTPPVMNISYGEKKSAAKFAAKKTDFGYIIEARIPRAEIPFPLAEGKDIAFEAMLYDSDEVSGPPVRKGIFTWASATDRYDARQAGRLSLCGKPDHPVVKHPGELQAASFIKTPMVEEGVFRVRPVAKTIAEAGVPLGLFFERKDVPALREKVRAGRPAACADMLLKIARLYLENVRPARWDSGPISEATSVLIEKYLVRLGFAYVLSDDARFADLARRTALKTCALVWPAGPAAARLQRGLACVLDFAGNALTPEETTTIRARLPKGDLRGAITAPAASLTVDLKAQDWIAWDGERYGCDFRLAALVGPPASWYAQAAAAGKSFEIQWLGDQVFQTFPARPDSADEVWTIIFYAPGVAAQKPARYDMELEKRAVARSEARLAELIGKRREEPKLPFERDAKQPMRAGLAGVHPRLVTTPGRREEMFLRGASVPPELWQPIATSVHAAEAPRRRGNGGDAGYTLIRIAAAYLATGQDFYAEDAIQLMRHACEYPHWGGFNHLPPDIDLDAGGLLFGIGVAYDVFHDCMTPDQREVIRRKLVAQAEKMYAYHHARKTIPWDQNHTYIDNGGLWCTAVALYGEVPEAHDWYDFGVRVIKNGMYVLNGADGAFYENIGYWYYGMATHFVQFMDLFRNVTGVDTFGYFRWQEKNKQYLTRMLLPGGQCQVDFGDAYRKPRSLGTWRTVMLKSATEYRDPEALAVADRFTAIGKLRPSEDLWPLLWWDPTVKRPEQPAVWPLYHRFEDFDIVCIRTGWDDDATHFAFRCGPAPGYRGTKLILNHDPPDWSPGTGHVHPDLNSFLIFDHGENLVVDTGYTICKRTRDHNTIAVDGAGQTGDGQAWPSYAPWDRYGRIGDFFAAPDSGYYYLRGEAANGYEAGLDLTRFDRHVLMMPDAEATYFVIDDVLESRKPHRYEWLLHSDAPASVGEGQSYTVTAVKRALTAHLLAPSGLVAKTEEVRVVPPPWEHETARGYRLFLSAAEPVASQRFLAVLTLHAAGERGLGVTGGDGKGMTVSGPGWTDFLAVGGSGDPIATDGHYAVVRSSPTDVLRWGVVAATRLQWRGEPLLIAAKPVSAASATTDRAVRVTLISAEAQETAVHVPYAPGGCEIDGKPVQGRYDPGEKMVRLAIPAGRHEIAIRP